jgi:hypothetical protein
MRLPDDVTDWLRRKAEYHVISMTAEMVRACRAAMVQEHREKAAQQ